MCRGAGTCCNILWNRSEGRQHFFLLPFYVTGPVQVGAISPQVNPPHFEPHSGECPQQSQPGLMASHPPVHTNHNRRVHTIHTRETPGASQEFVLLDPTGHLHKATPSRLGNITDLPNTQTMRDKMKLQRNMFQMIQST